MNKKELETWEAKFKLWKVLNRFDISWPGNSGRFFAGCECCPWRGWVGCPSRVLLLTSSNKLHNWRKNGKDGKGVCVEFIKHV